MYKYKLEPYSGSKSRYECPNCGDENSFTHYIDSETGKILFGVGRCNHESSCGYHYTPNNFFLENSTLEFENFKSWNYKPSQPTAISFFDMGYLINSESNFYQNNFIRFLLSKFEQDVVRVACEKYHIGTSDYWKGSTIFWYLDVQNRISSGKVMQYDDETGKRIKTKKGVPKINSMRKILIKKGLLDSSFNQKTGLFGEHLLNQCNDTQICVVESEKTAIIASIKFPEFIWLASGGRSFLTDERIKVLKGKNVTLYPDNDGFELWKKKAIKYNFNISTIVREKCTIPNADLADYILSFYDLTTILY